MITYRPNSTFIASVVLAICGTTGCAADTPSEVQPRENIPEATGWKQTKLIGDLHHPWGLAFLPGGDMLITERRGQIRIVREGNLLEESVSGVPDVFAQGQGGLMDISLHPKFEENNLVYITYSAGTREENRTTLARGVYTDGALSDLKVLFEATPTKSGGGHFGSRIAWLKDGTLLVSIGDGGNPPQQIGGVLGRDHGQRLDSTVACTVRLNEDGTAPEDNPFRTQEGARPELFTKGHRNIQGMFYDADNDRIWATEHGPRGGDELNLLRAGENFGWPEASHGRDYRTNVRISPHEALPEMIDPKVVWVPSKAPSGLIVYTGDKFPEWKGDIFSGALVGEEVRRVDMDGEKVMGEERLPMGRRVRDVRQGPDGFIYLLTDHSDGELIRLEPEGKTPQPEA